MEDRVIPNAGGWWVQKHCRACFAVPGEPCRHLRTGAYNTGIHPVRMRAVPMNTKRVSRWPGWNWSSTDD